MSSGYDGLSMLTTFFSQLVASTPLLAIWVIGLVLSLMRMGEDRRYRLTAAAFGIFLLAGVGGSLSTVLVLSLGSRDGAASVASVLGLFNLVLVAINSIGWIVLLVALFRRAAPAEG